MSLSPGNVLLVANYPPGVGYAWWLMNRFWQEIAEIAGHHGSRACIAYPSMGDVPEALRRTGVLPLECDFSKRSGAGLGSILRTLRAHQIRNLYLTDHPYFHPVYLAFRASGVRRIINHDHTPGDRPPATGLPAYAKDLRNRLPGMHVDQWIALSPLMRDRARLNARIPDHRISIVPNGIRPISHDPEARQRVRALFSLPPDSRVVVTVGRAHPYKRVDFVVHVAGWIKQNAPDSPITFVHFGDGPQLAELQAMARDSDLERSRFEFAGQRDDLRALLPGCDLAIHAAQGEGFSLAILEYMSAGLATLVPDIPSVSQAIDAGRTGFVFPDGDVAAAGRLLVSLAGSPAELARIGSAASREVREHYELGHTLEVFRRTVSAHFWDAPGEAL